MWVTKGLLYTYCIGQAQEKNKRKGKLVACSVVPTLFFGGWGSPPVDSSKKLATGRKYASSPRKQEAAFRGGSLCDDKTNCCVRRLTRASVVWDLTNEKIVSLSRYTGVYVTNTSASCFFFLMQTHHSQRKKGQVIDWSKHPLLLLFSYLAKV